MRIKTLQWNIGGGKIRKEADGIDGPYVNDGLDSIVAFIQEVQPDIVTLQETHADDHFIQARSIADRVGLPFVINDVYDKSHIEVGQGLGQAILSRFPLHDHSFAFFDNPHFQITRPDGAIWHSHDKGVSRVITDLGDGRTLELATTHFIPFRKFGLDPLSEEQRALRESITALLKPSVENFLLQGDFNYNHSSLTGFLTGLFESGVAEIPQMTVTTPFGRTYDHVVYRGLKLVHSEVTTEVLTDHFPIVSTFEI